MMCTSHLILGMTYSCIAVSSAYQNIALNKTAYQQNRYTQISSNFTAASNAVDGLKSDLDLNGGQCTISENNKQTAAWWVNLTKILSIHHIVIYHRTGNQEWSPTNVYTSRVLGFSLYVSNTTNKTDGTLCFRDTNFTRKTVPAVFNITCPVHGQYVIYYNERLAGVTYPAEYSSYAFNDLCEVEVHGCPSPGYYGYNCSIPCPDPQCRYCGLETGTCRGGCNAGYMGHKCDLKCTYGLYGDGCQRECGYCADLTQCHHVTGSCLGACKPGYKGDNCSQHCIAGYYGNNCSNECGQCLNGETCHHVNGSCLSGCTIGFQEPLCSKECNKTYGQGCTEICGHCRDSKPCHNINGSCMDGCSPGFKGEKCFDECETGFYGIGCLHECSTFCNTSRVCHPVSGYCKDGCKTGWQGNDCLEVYKAGDTSTIQQSSFYTVLGLFCISLLFNGVLIAHFIILRKSRKRPKKLNTLEKRTKEAHFGQSNKTEQEAANSEYEELGEFDKSLTTYETLH